LISAGGMKVAIAEHFEEQVNGALVFLGTGQGSERNASTKSKKNDARIRRAEKCSLKPRSPLAVPYERYLAYVILNAASRIAIVHAQDRRRLPPLHGGTIQNSVSSSWKKSKRVTQ
jgi:hypothetical protein